MVIEFPEERSSVYLFYGFSDFVLEMEASFDNPNYYETYEYFFGCQLEDSATGCPACPASGFVIYLFFHT